MNLRKIWEVHMTIIQKKFLLQFPYFKATRNLIHTFVPFNIILKAPSNIVVLRCPSRGPCSYLVSQTFSNICFLSGKTATSIRKHLFTLIFFTIMSRRYAWISISDWTLMMVTLFLCSHEFSLREQLNVQYIEQCMYCDALSCRCKFSVPVDTLLGFMALHW